MTGLNVGHVGIAGEVRCIVKRKDGSVKEDTGFQKNLILNQGLDFFGGGKGSDIFYRCVIGSGNSNPLITQTQLDSFLAITSGVEHSSKYNYVPDSSNLYKTNKVFKYTFSGLSSVNVSEVGLVSQGTTSSNYYLCTRALLKDIAGLPTTITILSGEVLEVYYKVWRVVSTLDATYVVNMLDGKGGSVPYNCIVRPLRLGNDIWNNTTGRCISAFTLLAGTLSELSNLTSPVSGIGLLSATPSLSTYVQGSYKINESFYIDITKANDGIRVIESSQSPGFVITQSQIRFGSVTGDNPIPKTNLQTLTIPLEFSWGRYEGEL